MSFSIIQNKNTSQQGIASGLTGTQAIKWIPCPRMYVKTAETLVGAPQQQYYTKSNGVTPTGWTDLGSVDGNVKVTYDQKVEKVTTGVDEFLRGAYLKSKGGMLEFSLAQTDDAALQAISGMTASIIVAGSIVNYQVGSTDMSQLAVLYVCQDKLTGKEMQFYNPNCFFTFNYDMSGDALILKCQGFVPFFSPAGAATTETIFGVTIFA